MCDEVYAVHHGHLQPRTPAEWQEAVDGAEFFLGLDACRQYGLITGVPEIDTYRAVELLKRGRAKGFVPKPWDELIRIFLAPPEHTDG